MIEGYLLLEYPLRVVLGLACVDREGFSETNGGAELACKDALLDVARRVVVMVVETDFAPSDTTRVSHRVEACGRGGG